MRFARKREIGLIDRFAFFLTLLLLFRLPRSAYAAAGGSISGTVKDPTGGVIARATVTVTNVERACSRPPLATRRVPIRSPTLAVGHYNLDVADPGSGPIAERA